METRLCGQGKNADEMFQLEPEWINMPRILEID
jgi:hypothetical protein